MALWELEEFQNPTFLGFIRSIPEPEEFLGGSADILPNRTIGTLEYEYILGANNSQARRSIMANVMGWDSEAPIHGRRVPTAAPESTVRGELPPIKRKAKLSEKEIIKFKQPRPGTSDREDVINYVYDLTDELVTAVQARLEWLRMQAISEDVVVVDQEGVDVAIDFGVPTTQQFNVNTDDNLSTWWEDTTNSNPLTDLDYICNKYEVDHGVRPARQIADPTTLQVLLNNVNLRELARGPGGPAIRLTTDELNALFTIYQLPSLRTYDVSFLEENHDGTLTAVRPFNRRKTVLLPPESITLGNTLLGPTAESRNIPGVAYTQYAPGIVGSIYGKDEPPSEWVKVAAVGFPSLPGAEYVVQMTMRNDLT
jgi:hypothetical protein